MQESFQESELTPSFSASTVKINIIFILNDYKKEISITPMHQHKFQKNQDYLNNDYFAICFLFQSINKSLPHYLISFYPCKIVVFFKLSSHKIQILQARLQRYVKHEIPDVQDSFRKGRGTRDQTANICWIIKKAREFQKNIYFCLIDYAKPLTVWITINCGKF